MAVEDPDGLLQILDSNQIVLEPLPERLHPLPKALVAAIIVASEAGHHLVSANDTESSLVNDEMIPCSLVITSGLTLPAMILAELHSTVSAVARP